MGITYVVLWCLSVLYMLWLYVAGPPHYRLRARRERYRGRMEERAHLRSTRREWARADLKSARKNAIVDFRVEDIAAIPEAIKVSNHIDPSHSRRNGLDQDRNTDRSALETLPPELRQHIYGLLDYGSAILLSGTSRFFNNDNPVAFVCLEQRSTYVLHAETFPQNKMRLACFRCLRLLPRLGFPLAMRVGAYAQYAGSLEWKRSCRGCSEDRHEIDLQVAKAWLKGRILRLSEWLEAYSRRQHLDEVV